MQDESEPLRPATPGHSTGGASTEEQAREENDRASAVEPSLNGSSDDEPDADDGLDASSDDEEDGPVVRRRSRGAAANDDDDDSLFIDDVQESNEEVNRTSRLRRGATVKSSHSRNATTKTKSRGKGLRHEERDARKAAKAAKAKKREAKKAHKRQKASRHVSGANAAISAAPAAAVDSDDEDTPIGLAAAAKQLPDDDESEMEYSDSDEVSDESDSDDPSEFTSEAEEESDDASAWSDDGRRRAKGPKEPRRPKKMRKRSALSEDDEPATTLDGDGSPDGPPVGRAPPTAEMLAEAAKLKHKFSAAPRKEIDTKLLKSGDFLIVGSIGRVSSWKLPYKDRRGRVNVHLLQTARQVIKTGKTASGKKPIDYTIPTAVAERVEKLWSEAKAWHRVYGRTVADSAAARAEELREAQAAKRKAEKAAAKAAEVKAADAKAKAEARAARLASGASIDSSDEEETILNAVAGNLDASPKARGMTADDAGNGDTRTSQVKPAPPPADDDEEGAWLRDYEEEMAKEKAKAAFWRRDNFINDDSEEEGEGEGSVAGSEALEEGERAREKPLEFGRMSSQQVYDMLHSDSQRLLRKAASALPCTKTKSISISNVLSKIESRRLPIISGPVQDEAEHEELEEADLIVCAQCQKTLDADDTPLREAAVPPPCDGCVPLFCSKLCISMYRTSSGRVGMVEKSEEAVESSSAVACGLEAAGLADVDSGAMTTGVKAEVDDEQEDDMLIVLPAALKESERDSKSQLQRLMSAGETSGLAVSRRISLRQQLSRSMSDQKKEEARSTGRYVETEPSQGPLVAGESDEEDANDDEDEVTGVNADDMNDVEAGEQTAGNDELDADEVANALVAPGASSAAADQVLANVQDESNDAQETVDAGEAVPTDELSMMMAASRRKAQDLAAMRERVEAEMAKRMDTGVHVNPVIAAAYGVAVPGEAASSSFGETQEQDDKYCSRVSSGAEAEPGLEEELKVADKVAAPLLVPPPARRTFAGIRKGPQQSRLGFTALSDQPKEASHESTTFCMPKSIDESIAEHEQALDLVEQESALSKEQPMPGANGQEAAATRERQPSLVMDEAEDSDDGGEAVEADGDGYPSDNAVEGSFVVEPGIVEDNEDDEGAHALHAAELAAADDDAHVEAYVQGLKKRAAQAELRNVGKQRRLTDEEVHDESVGAAHQDDDKEASSEDEAGLDRNEDDDSDDVISSIGEFIASDDEVDAEVEAAERRAFDLHEEEEEEEENAVDRVIRTRLGPAWIVADRSAPALEGFGNVTGDDDDATAVKARLELRAKRKRERELEEAAEADRAAAVAAAADVARPPSGGRISAEPTADGGSRLFAGLERSLSSFSAFSVLSDTTLGTAPAPKRTALQRSLSSNVVGALHRPTPVVGMPSTTPSSGTAAAGNSGVGIRRTSSMGAIAAAGPAVANGLAVNGTGSSTSATTAGVGATGAAGGVGVSAPPAVHRLSSFQDRERYRTPQMMSQLGVGSSTATSSSKGFVFRAADQSQSAASALEDPLIEGTRTEYASHGVTAAPLRTPPSNVGKSSTFGSMGGGGTSSHGASLLATVLNGAKNWKRAASKAK